MADEFYPAEINELPEIDVPFSGVRGRLLQGPGEQLIFFDIEPIGGVTPHSHGAQWGVVLDGEVELTIGDETRTYRKGDTYYIPAGVVHSARFGSRTRAIDFFAEPQRYKAKEI
jgi:quercetin dioxygenase-like cupin family protein